MPKGVKKLRRRPEIARDHIEVVQRIWNDAAVAKRAPGLNMRIARQRRQEPGAELQGVVGYDEMASTNRIDRQGVVGRPTDNSGNEHFELLDCGRDLSPPD